MEEEVAVEAVEAAEVAAEAVGLEEEEVGLEEALLGIEKGMKAIENLEKGEEIVTTSVNKMKVHLREEVEAEVVVVDSIEEAVMRPEEASSDALQEESAVNAIHVAKMMEDKMVMKVAEETLMDKEEREEVDLLEDTSDVSSVVALVVLALTLKEVRVEMPVITAKAVVMKDVLVQMIMTIEWMIVKEDIVLVVLASVLVDPVGVAEEVVVEVLAVIAMKMEIKVVKMAQMWRLERIQTLREGK